MKVVLGGSTIYAFKLYSILLPPSTVTCILKVYSPAVLLVFTLKDRHTKDVFGVPWHYGYEITPVVELLNL